MCLKKKKSSIDICWAPQVFPLTLHAAYSLIPGIDTIGG